MTQEIEYTKVLHCPDQDGVLVEVEDCCGCEYYEDTDTFSEFVKCNCPKVLE
jgi:hypothetical protein